MNDEIKEILWIIKSCKQDYDKQKDGMHTFDYGELYLLYNYITNLQEENEYLKKNNPEQNIEHFRIIKENKRKINNLREENKTLQENNQNMQEEMARVWEENERLKAKYDNDKSHEVNYKYFTTLYSKATKDIVIDDLVYKCEDLDNLRQSYEKLYIEKEDYKSRCEKAIEYMKCGVQIECVNCHTTDEFNFEDLLNILQGENNGN